MTVKEFYISVEYILIHRIFADTKELRIYFKSLANRISDENGRNDILKRIDFGEFDDMYVYYD